MNEISISGLDKAVVLAALYNASRPQGLGFIHADSKNMSVDEARELLKTHTYFDYLKGRVMKIDLKGDILWTALYNRDLGEGAAERVVEQLRQKITK